MKIYNAVIFLILVNVGFVNAQETEFYQLKKYFIQTDKQETMVDNFLEKVYLPSLHNINIKDVGVFKQTEPISDSLSVIYVLIPFKSLEQFSTLEATLKKATDYQTDGATFLNAPTDNPAYERIESILLEAFERMPSLKVPQLDSDKSKRIYELRSYESPTEIKAENKIDMFNGGGEIALFERLGFNAVFYAKVLSGPAMPNLMYMTTFSDMESRDQHWKAFNDAPEWRAMTALPKYKGKNVSHIDVTFLYPTAYSDY